MADPKDIIMFRGKSIDEMTRVELIEAIQCLGRALDSSRENHQATLDMWRAFRERAYG